MESQKEGSEKKKLISVKSIKKKLQKSNLNFTKSSILILYTDPAHRASHKTQMTLVTRFVTKPPKVS